MGNWRDQCRGKLVTPDEAVKHINAGDVKLPEGVDLVSSPDAVLFTVAFVAAPVLEAESPTEEPTEEAPTEE